MKETTLHPSTLDALPIIDRPDLDEFLRGGRIYGDDFTPEEVARWYRDEEDGYSSMVASENHLHDYHYHALNQLHGYRHLGEARFDHVLGFGSGFGYELLPIASRIERVSLVDASSAYERSDLPVKDVRTYKARSSGDLPFDDEAFDLATCFGVLHHIPNVSHVLREMHRTVKRGAPVLLREPISSMGDWRARRRGLTKRERGFPLGPFTDAMRRAGFEIERYEPCMFPLVPALWKAMHRVCFNSPLAARVDMLLSRASAWNYTYHRTRLPQKLAPASGYWILRRPR